MPPALRLIVEEAVQQHELTLRHQQGTMQIDCANRKIKDISVIFYDEKGKVVYSSPKSETGEWNDNPSL